MVYGDRKEEGMGEGGVFFYFFWEGGRWDGEKEGNLICIVCLAFYPNILGNCFSLFQCIFTKKNTFYLNKEYFLNKKGIENYTKHLITIFPD